jgi:hypothetical protein
MSRTLIASTGAVAASGFLAAAATANFLFGTGMGRTPTEGLLIGVVGVLAVAMNALCPFFLSWSLAGSRRTTAASIVVLWALCLTYSTTSALGFVAQNRESVTAGRQVTHDAYEDTRRELFDLESRRKDAKAKDRPRLDARVDEVRRRLARLRSDTPVPADAQAAFLSAMTFGYVDAHSVRIALATLFAVMVEVGATIGLFAALSHAPPPPAAPASRWKPKGA